MAFLLDVSWGSLALNAALVLVPVLALTPFVQAGNSLPPGPLLRHILPITHKPELILHDYAKKYGPLFSVWMGQKLFIVISEPQIARDLLTNAGAIMSSRSPSLKNTTILHHRGITASKYDDRWRLHRRLGNYSLSIKAIDSYAHVLDYEASVFVHTLYAEGNKGAVSINPMRHAGRFAFNNMLTISVGTRSATDPMLERTLDLAMDSEFMELTGALCNETDFWPILEYLPNSKYKRAQALHNKIISIYGDVYNSIKTKIDNGEGVPDCLVRTLIESSEIEKLDWLDTCLLAAAFTMGGVHSTSGVIDWFLALIPLHPEVQRKAQEELDRVVGRERWPNAVDENNLPYIRAIIKEVERLHAPFWIPAPHCATEDYDYNGMFIPKDAVLILNCYTMHHNEERYPDPYTFNPDRFLGDNLTSEDSAKLLDPYARDHWAFGAGRRICPGMAVAERELFLAFSRILWSFNVLEDPKEPIDLGRYRGKAARTPLGYKVIFEPRHEKVHQMLAEIQETVVGVS
ncbi:cytochrome P450 [Roridomyces roridus]|uniref:Cytochrome P450 n=1 Tax=Roridomyces roridus TaxID=1738132 RepID=A0AAD7FTG1_9AGAR|nr:cytochrome P450 [Roridomyces roridus]